MLELAQEATLFEYIMEGDKYGFKESFAVVVFEQFVKGLKALHVERISNRDLKTENTLLDFQNNIKIADLGLSSRYTKFCTKLGTKGQLAPEIEYL